MLAEHIDPSCGAVVVSQDVLAEMVGVSERTIRRATAYLEEVLALVRIRVSGSVYAYALDPKRSGARGTARKSKPRSDAHPREEERPERAREAQTQMMLREQTGEPELQLEQDFDPETGEVRAS